MRDNRMVQVLPFAPPSHCCRGVKVVDAPANETFDRSTLTKFG
jgi:hypothetical protein